MPEHAFVLYYLGLSQRAVGVKTLALAAKNPTEAKALQAQALLRFDEASRQFAAAATAFMTRVKNVDPQSKENPLDLEWAARARCDQAEMLLRLQKPKQSSATPMRPSSKTSCRAEPLSQSRALLSRLRQFPAEGESRRRSIAQHAGTVRRSDLRHARPLSAGPHPSRRRRTGRGDERLRCSCRRSQQTEARRRRGR